MHIDDITAVILAGGLGTRLRQTLADRPKVLAQVAGRPFLAYKLDQLDAAGIRHVVLCIGHMGQMVCDTFGSTHKSLAIDYSQESAPLGTAGALRQALAFMRSDTVLAMNGDSYCQADLGAFFAWHHARKGAASLLLTEVSDTARYGRVAIDTQGFITCFAEKTGAHTPGLINAGMYLLGRHLLESIPAGRAVSIEREVFPEASAHGLYGYTCQASFIDIGTPDDYRAAEVFFTSLGEGGCTPNVQSKSGGSTR